MKTLKIKLGDHLFTSGKVTAWDAREAIAINKDAVRVPKMAAAGAGDGESYVDFADQILTAMDEVATRKANLICNVYGGQFTPDELEKSHTPDEIDEQITMIIYGVDAVITKNSSGAAGRPRQ